jgi:glyoxylase-like metal-dependent hydrolase (beta-lactamase superfamily II)
VRRLLAGIGWALLLLVAVAAGFLAEAHWEIRGLVPVLPDRGALAALADAADGPVAVSTLNTASQRGPGRPTMAHPAFVLEWADGRLFLIDTGMDRAGALAFGAPMELLIGSEPIEPHGPPAEQLGDAARRVAGVAFTHLHHDHTGGLASLCVAVGRSLPVFQTPWQADRGNYTTRLGRTQLAAAGCARPERLAGGPLQPVPGFPGLAALPVGGHTPGSTVYFAHVKGHTWIFSGDVTNFRQALLDNRPKERVYSLLVTPEAPEPLETLRVWLAALDREPGFTVVVSHDADALAETGPPPWTPPPL